MVKIILCDFEAENRNLDVVDHLAIDDMVSWSGDCTIDVFFPQHHMFKSSAKREDFTGNLIASHMSLMAT